MFVVLIYPTKISIFVPVLQIILTKYTNIVGKPLRIKQKKSVKSLPAPLEQVEQEAVAMYLDTQYPNVLYCASAGGLRTSLRSAVKMKKAGYKKGFPDLFIYEPRDGCNGLAIEMKRKEGIVTLEQKIWIGELQARGYQSWICRGFDEAKRVIDDYFGPWE